MAARAIQRGVRQSPRKMRLVIDQIRGLPVEEAYAILEYSTKKAAEVINKTLRSAVANARVKADNEKHDRNAPLPTMEDIKEVYGSSYRNMMSDVKETFANYETLFPELKGKKLEIAGFTLPGNRIRAAATVPE